MDCHLNQLIYLTHSVVPPPTEPPNSRLDLIRNRILECLLTSATVTSLLLDGELAPCRAPARYCHTIDSIDENRTLYAVSREKPWCSLRSQPVTSRVTIIYCGQVVDRRLTINQRNAYLYSVMST
jgi:hypothetical protein